MPFYLRLSAFALIVFSLLLLLPDRTAAMPDFDTDGKADLGVFRASDRQWYSFSSAFQTFSAVPWGLPDDVLVPGDYDGDSLTDLAVWRPGSGVWFVLPSRNQPPLIIKWGTKTSVPPGFVSDEPVPADYDGDGRTDIAVWRPSTGVWYVLRSSNGFDAERPLIGYWGKLGDIPVPADYDGDGCADFAVFRSTENRWYIQKSSDGKWKVSTFGLAGYDLLVPADYSGDGLTDIAVYRSGTWYVERSDNAAVEIYHFGLNTDTPVPADYSGDGRADIAVFRDGTWYLMETSTMRIRIAHFGTSGDVPVKSINTGRISMVPVP